ncbi:hypothetical protein RND71_007404 [Anisodus tanguticus]|uniref:Uncharacterized protein n=1 Tax=Anisodus tanguticus TaxID=243964 RepID=A0AAE1SLU4_9SOLA|nr:hypothetical protein RND71_007404 [Anisodus tanguticus]
MEILQESGWEELRKEARKIEGDLDVKLSSYAKLGARVTQGVASAEAVSYVALVGVDLIVEIWISSLKGYVEAGSPTLGSSRSWKSMEMEIQSLLEKLLDVNDSMSRCAASAAPTTSVTQKLARHRDILHEFTQWGKVSGSHCTAHVAYANPIDYNPFLELITSNMSLGNSDVLRKQSLLMTIRLAINAILLKREFRRIKGNISSMREHAELLSSVRDDISEYKASGSSPKMQILRERAAIHGSITHELSLESQEIALGSWS